MEAKQSELNIVEVIPIVKGVTKSTLSYFSKDKFEVGNFVKIPLRKGQAQGIVVNIKNAKSARSEVRRADFMLKKLVRKEVTHTLSPYFIEAARMTADFYATTVGSILGSMLPKLVLEDPSLISTSIVEFNRNRKSPEPLLIQMEDDDRFREYKSIIRECFAKKCSVLFCVPTHEDALRIFEYLSKGIEKYAFTTSGKTPGNLKKTLLTAKAETHPIVFITTYSYLCFERDDFQTIILERENSRSYRTLSRPFIHIRTFLENLAKVSGKKYIMGDSVLSLESLWREKQGHYTDLSPLRWRSTRDAESLLVDMKVLKNNTDPESKKVFEIFSPELKEMLSDALEERNKVFLFGVRKGLAPSTVCGDCGTVLPCQNCGSPVVLHEKKDETKERIYLCHACGAHRNALTTCDNCKSWKLIPLGIGIDRIKYEVESLYPQAQVFVLDKDNAPTQAQAQKIAREFGSSRGGILIGTELAFLYLEKIPYSAIVSLDSLFSIPDFGINERIFYLANRLREFTTKKTIFQTRNIGKEILTFANDGNILDFYRSEIDDREALLYPPFSIFIKVTTTGTVSEIEAKASDLRRLFIEFVPDFIRFRSHTPGLFTLSMVIRVARIHWPDPILKEKLLLLTPDFLIKVDPESIL
jgi:primosomal protein N'